MKNNIKWVNITDIYNGEYYIIFDKFVQSDSVMDRYSVSLDGNKVFIDKIDSMALLEEWNEYIDELKTYFDDNVDEFSYHELLDRTHVIMTNLDSNLYKHVITHLYPNIKDKVSDISTQLYDLYCMIAEVSDVSEKNFKK